MYVPKTVGPIKKSETCLLNRNIPLCQACGEKLVRGDRYYQPPFVSPPNICPAHGREFEQNR